MIDETLFDIEIFGFHAQQTVEKLRKSWLSAINVKYERTHDLQILFSMLKENGQQIPAELEILENLTDFSVNFRYDVFDNIDASLDRLMVIDKIKQLKNLVNNILT